MFCLSQSADIITLLCCAVFVMPSIKRSKQIGEKIKDKGAV
jgi:hypothetical protein